MHIKKKIFVLLTVITFTSQGSDMECPNDAGSNVFSFNPNKLDRATTYKATSNILSGAISQALLSVMDKVLIPEDELKQIEGVTDMKDGRYQMMQEFLSDSGNSLGKIRITMGKGKTAEELREGLDYEEDGPGVCPASNDVKDRQCQL